jgi:hypothetical protein
MDNASRLSIIIKDCEEMLHILAEFCDAVLTSKIADEQQASVRRKESKEWTFHQTLAHVTAAAEFYQQALEITLSGTTFSPQMQKRTDLPAINDHEIAARQHLTRHALTQDLLRAFKQTAQRVQTLTPEALTQQVNVPLFNRPLTIAEILDMQLVHPGVLHAAQLTNGVGMKPLWVHCTSELMHHQITRLFQTMALVYWPERGGDLQASINFIIGGQGGGRWSLTIQPSGGSYSEHTVRHAALTIWARNTHALCQFVTNQESALSALWKGKLLIWGDMRLGLKLSWLFSPT